MAVARHLAICPPMDTCLSLIEEAMKQEECSKPIPRLPCSPAKGNPGGSKGWREKLDYERAQDKHMLASSLGLVRTDLFPRIQALMEWRRRRRLRRQRQSKLGSSSAEPPSNAVTVSLPVSSPVNTCLHKKPEKEIPIASTSIHKKVTRKSQNIPAHVPQSDRSTRSKGVKPDVITASTGKQCVKTGDRVTPPSKCRDKAKAKTVEVVRNQRSPALKTNLSKSSMRGVDKAKVRSKGRRETSGMAMREGVNDGTPDSPPPSMDQEKHQSKRALPMNPLDSDFVSDSHQSTGEATAAKGKEEKSVDGSSQAGELLPCRVLRTRGPPIIPPMTRAREERSNKRRHHVSKSAGPEAATSRPKRTKASLDNPRYTMPDTVRRAQLKQLREPRSQTAKITMVPHTCLQCEASYMDCDALIMHRLGHIKGRQWSCLLCSKKFLRLRNVRSHIRTHKPKLYKCQSCIVAAV